MCGILGIATRLPLQGPDMTSRMRNAMVTLRHRGPDDQGEYRHENIWLAHTRLSIIDPSPAGHQPLLSADGRFVISYNGEVYNFRELARIRGLADLRSSCDTEVVLRLFAEGGVGSLCKFNGMFAFALFDAQARKLWLIRDRLGIKPLYYRLTADRAVFASEIKGILALDPGASHCDSAALHEWLYYGNPLGEGTLYRGIRQLLPGHYLELDLNSFNHEIRAYWSLEEAGKEVATITMRGKQDVVEETRRLLEQAVMRQLVADVPVGVFLSGGIDSSAIAAFASRHYGHRLATYSAGFDFARGVNELPRAKRTAAHYGTEHHEIHVAGGNIAALVEKMVRHHDMPFADAANLPIYLLASQIAPHAKVVLQGDGGDELFGGYRRYSTLAHYRTLHVFARLAGQLNRLMPKSAFHFRVQRYLHALAAGDFSMTMALLSTSEDPHLAPEMIFGPGLRQAVMQSDPFVRFRECQRAFGAHDLGNRMSMTDLSIVLPDTYLEKVDRAAMAASLEVRIPFLDNDLVDFVVSLPARTKMPHGRKKGLLKAALADVVPDEVLQAPKTGLTVPYGDWLQGALKPLFFDHLARFSRQNPDVLNLAHVKRLWEDTASGRQNRAYMLWKVLNFMIWADHSHINFFETTV